jgi:hypothetical protein
VRILCVSIELVLYYFLSAKKRLEKILCLSLEPVLYFFSMAGENSLCRLSFWYWRPCCREITIFLPCVKVFALSPCPIVSGAAPRRRFGRVSGGRTMRDLDECIERCCNMEILEQEEVVQLCERLKQILMVLPRAPAPAHHPHVTRCLYCPRAHGPHGVAP